MDDPLRPEERAAVERARDYDMEDVESLVVIIDRLVARLRAERPPDPPEIAEIRKEATEILGDLLNCGPKAEDIAAAPDDALACEPWYDPDDREHLLGYIIDAGGERVATIHETGDALGISETTARSICRVGPVLRTVLAAYDARAAELRALRARLEDDAVADALIDTLTLTTSFDGRCGHCTVDPGGIIDVYRRAVLGEELMRKRDHAMTRDDRLLVERVQSGTIALLGDREGLCRIIREQEAEIAAVTAALKLGARGVEQW